MLLVVGVAMALTDEQQSVLISASAKFDPGTKDSTGQFAGLLAAHRGEAMSNVEYVPNDDPKSPYDGKGIPTYDDAHPAPDPLGDYSSYWHLRDGVKRKPVLIVEDMEGGYFEYVDYVIPRSVKILSKFRELGLPVIWTNWVRKAGDGYYGALDRFYGPQGIDNEENPCYIYGETGPETVGALAPQSLDEFSRTIMSLHLSKFADLDDRGRHILYPLLKKWGVDTVIIIGAWTDDCVLATAYDAVDKYGFDTVLVEDAVATSTLAQGSALDIAGAGLANVVKADELVSILDDGVFSMPPWRVETGDADEDDAYLQFNARSAGTVSVRFALLTAAFSSVVTAVLLLAVVKRGHSGYVAASTKEDLE